MLFDKAPNYLSLANTFYNPNSTIARLSVTGRPQEEFLCANITEFESSEVRKTMLKAQEYFRNRSDIKDRKRWFFGRNGEKFEIKALSNTKLAHPWLYKIINQKVNYLMTDSFEVRTLDDKYKDLLKTEYFDKKFSRLFKNTLSHAIINGIAWMQVYYDEAGILSFKRIPSEQVIPFWADTEHTVLDALIRYYTIIEYQPGGGKKEVTKVEFYDKTGVWYYVQSDNGLIPDKDKADINPTTGGQESRGHFNVVQKDEETGDVIETPVLWEKVPFVAVKYNPEEMPLLELIKSMVDDYDEITSDNSNNVKDMPNAIKIIKGYAGNDKEEFSKNLAVFRAIFVGPDGDVSNLDSNIDSSASDSHLDRLKDDINYFASAVDTQKTDLGNASGVAIKFRYGDLDNDMTTFEGQLQQAFEELAFFIDVDLQGAGKGDFTEVEFEIQFNKTGIINETETIGNAKNSVGVVSDETILSHHPWVSDVKDEAAKLETQAKKQLEDEVTSTKALNAANGLDSGFGQPNKKGASSGKSKQ